MLSISISLIAVFIPILLMGGIVGRLFREFAVTLSVAILVSLVISLTTTPMMCSRLLKHATRRERTAGSIEPARSAFNWMLSLYERSLSWVLRHPAFTLARSAAHHCRQRLSAHDRAKGFFPQQDNGPYSAEFRERRIFRSRPCRTLTRAFRRTSSRPTRRCETSWPSPAAAARPIAGSFIWR